jgi:hypothetical protein
MAIFTVGIFGRGTNIHAACFEDFAKALADALRALGHAITGFEHPGRLIMFGANNASDVYNKMPSDAIVFNTEQVAAEDIKHKALARLQMQNYEQYKKHVVWDYSKANAKTLKEYLGMPNVIHCPLGYIESMTKPLAQPANDQDIDVLFYGAVSPRRKKVLDELEAKGLRVEKLFGVYGDERDKVIARSKIVLNVRFFESGVFEIFRVSHLLANRACVVSEIGGQDKELEEIAGRTVRCAPIHEIVDSCCELVADTKKRREVAENGFEEFKKISLVENVRQALEAS